METERSWFTNLRGIHLKVREGVTGWGLLEEVMKKNA